MVRYKLLYFILSLFILSSIVVAWEISPESWGHIYCKLVGCKIEGDLNVTGNSYIGNNMTSGNGCGTFKLNSTAISVGCPGSETVYS